MKPIVKAELLVQKMKSNKKKAESYVKQIIFNRKILNLLIGELCEMINSSNELFDSPSENKSYLNSLEETSVALECINSILTSEGVASVIMNKDSYKLLNELEKSLRLIASPFEDDLPSVLSNYCESSASNLRLEDPLPIQQNLNIQLHDNSMEKPTSQFNIGDLCLSRPLSVLQIQVDNTKSKPKVSNKTVKKPKLPKIPKTCSKNM